MTALLFSEEDLLPLSGLQHLVFCERQCALIHVEQAWADNALTVEGTHLHRRAHEGPRREQRGGVLIVRGLPLRSLRLGVSGVADVVEFRAPTGDRSSTVSLASVAAQVAQCWVARPVEYKRGKPKLDRCDEVQLCAQGMCLEEMLAVTIQEGALYYGATQRRRVVSFDDELRRLTEAAAARLHEVFRAGITPATRRQPKCRRCSLLARCRPDALSIRRTASRYVRAAIKEVLMEDGRP